MWWLSARLGNLWDKTDSLFFPYIYHTSDINMESEKKGHFSFFLQQRRRNIYSHNLSTPWRLRGLLRTRLLHNTERSSLTFTTTGVLVPERRRHWESRKKKGKVFDTGLVRPRQLTSRLISYATWRRSAGQKNKKQKNKKQTNKRETKGQFPPFALACWDTSVSNVLARWPSGLKKTTQSECTSYTQITKQISSL